MPHTVSVCERVRVYEYMSESRDGGEKLKKKRTKFNPFSFGGARSCVADIVI